MPADETTFSPERRREGGCYCGRLRYRVSGEPAAVNACHCRDCQRLTGSAFAINAMFETHCVEALGSAWSDGDRLGQGLGERRWQCADCGTLLFADHPAFADAMRFVRVGTLDRGEEIQPDAHYFVRSKHHWVVIPPGIPQFDTLPDQE